MKRQMRPSPWVVRLRALTWKQIAKKVLGVVLILVGLFALLTPFSPGSWLALIGLEFLGLRILLQDKLLAWAHANPSSTVVRLVCRLMFVWERDPVAKRRWGRLWKGQRKRPSNAKRDSVPALPPKPTTPCASERSPS